MVRLIHDALSRSAERAPEAEAFRFQGDALTYGALQSEAARLAGVLGTLGVERGDRVGIYLRKSLRMPAAVYGILRAGAAFVPLDTAAPAGRTEDVLRQCGASVLIADQDLARPLSGMDLRTAGVRHVIGLSGDALEGVEATGWDEVGAAPEAPAARVIEDDIAYLMFTSGSTGTPKGIVHTHRSGLAYAEDAVGLYGIRPGDRMANHSALHFDMALFEFFGAPLAGATAILVPEVFTRLPAELAGLTEAERISVWYSVPTALVQMLLHGGLEARDLSALRWVIFAGEPFPPRHLASLMRLLPRARFSNAYGPAEVNVCTYHHVDAAPEPDCSDIPIGMACASAETLIVDENGNPVSPGTPGELLVRSATSMRGYWNRPDLTDRAFFRRAVSPGVEDVFYRTGDRVVDRGDGVMRFLGRKDRQVKVRGYRVELEEVEAVLCAHEAVAEAGAFLASSGTEIGAAVTLGPGVQVTCEDLAAHCRQSLPGYAAPARVHILPDLPKTGSNKVDRNALRALIEAPEYSVEDR